MSKKYQTLEEATKDLKGYYWREVRGGFEAVEMDRIIAKGDYSGRVTIQEETDVAGLDELTESLKVILDDTIEE